MQTQSKIGQLRRLMTELGLAAYVLPGTDPHQNEYLPDMWKRREWLSGFTGSAGSVVVTANMAGLWTDSRYFIQAENQLAGSGITLFRIGQAETPDIWQWLINELPPGSKIGIDPLLISCKQAQHVNKKLRARKIQLQYLEKNLVDVIWTNRPGMPPGQAIPHPIGYSGEEMREKTGRLREELRKENCDAIILTTLDTIAWLFNIRGKDITYNPLVIAYAIITDTEAILFMDPGKKNPALEEHLGETVRILPYSEFESFLLNMEIQGKRFWLDERHTNARIGMLLEKAELHPADNPLIHFKAIKNTTEIINFEAAHLRDGVAMVKFLAWLFREVPTGNISEDSAARHLQLLREEQELYRDLSFTTISAYAEHGAIVHYAHTDSSNSLLKSEGLYLLDSGAHYLDGTTDITRTLALGKPTPEQILHYTLVLKGHIDLALTSFPEGTQGIQLDAIARKPLWDRGLDYGHGTGHGIGSYLNVHEGPQSISQSRGVPVKLQPGMFCSIEPGYYAPGKYGIRIENIVYIKKDKKRTTAGSTFYRFETITLCPFDKALIDPTLLTAVQLDYINSYHKEVRDKIGPRLVPGEKEWLEEATAPLETSTI